MERLLEDLVVSSRWLLAPLYLVLIGNLIVMVALSGYETFISRIDKMPETEKPS